MARIEERYWWFAGRRAVIESLLGQAVPRGRGGHAGRLLDVGCGTGATLAALARFSVAVGLDVEPAALAFCLQRGQRRLIQGTAARLPVKDTSFDVVTALDVIEHLDDDLGALREFHRALRPGGHLLLTVPAYPFIWSEHDEALHHKRRYLKGGLLELLRRAGFRPIRASYSLMGLLPLALLLRLAQRLRPRSAGAKTSYLLLPDPLNNLFIAYMRLEAFLLKRFSFPAGLTIVCLAGKDEGPAPRTAACRTCSMASLTFAPDLDRRAGTGSADR